MLTRQDLAPLFTEVPMSSDEAIAIVAALHDIAESDGMHEQELQMISGFVEMLDADLGEVEPHKLEGMTPDKLAASLTDPTLRIVAVQCAVLLGWADGALSSKERERIVQYADALDVRGERYEQIEKLITEWVKQGDFETVLS